MLSTWQRAAGSNEIVCKGLAQCPEHCSVRKHVRPLHSSAPPLLLPYTWVVGYGLQGQGSPRCPHPRFNMNTLLMWSVRPPDSPLGLRTAPPPPQPLSPQKGPQSVSPLLQPGWVFVLSGQETTSGSGYCFSWNLPMGLRNDEKHIWPPWQ